MDEFARLILLLALAGVALTLMGGAAIWFMDEGRRIRRGLKTVLKADPHAMLIARGRGRGVGFNFTSNRLAVAWDCGGWCLIYRVEELAGAELIVDGQVLARAHRGEARRALDMLTGADERVRLRLIFDDPAHPDFDLDLWLPEDEGRKGSETPAEVVQEANRWIARTEALLRRQLPHREAAAVARPPDRAPAPKPNAAPPPRADAPTEPTLFDAEPDKDEDETIT